MAQQAPINPFGVAPNLVQPQGHLAQQAPINPFGVAPAPKRRTTLGTLGLVMVILCAGVLGFYMWRIGHTYARLTDFGKGSSDMTDAEALRFSFKVWRDVWMELAIFGGLIGWILGIVATATKRGRAAGIATIVIGVVAPLVAGLLIIPGYLS
jgi:hypothetical protein